MSTPQLPRKTQEIVTLPGGMLVLVCILNSLYRDQADAEARRYAMRACLRFLPGGADYKAVQAEMRQMNDTRQSEYLAGREYWNIRNDALSRFPDDPEPEQGAHTPEQYAAAFQAWQKTTTENAKKRTAYEEAQWQKEIARAQKLSKAERQTQCESLYFAQEWGKEFTQRLQWETLYRACRGADAPAVRVYESAGEIEAADDATQAALWAAYQGLEVPASVLPTSPPASPD